MNGLRYVADRTIEVDVIDADLGGPYDPLNEGMEYTEHLERALRRHGLDYVASCARIWTSGKSDCMEFKNSIRVQRSGTYRIEFAR